MPRQPMQNQPQKIPQVYYQTSTSNQSFINMHYILKSLGIRNNRQHLILLDPDLAGVNPRDPRLSRMMKVKVLRECSNNFWYFIREVVRIPSPGVPGGIPFQLHRGNMAMMFLLIRNINTFLELPRQQGKTISALCWYLWVFNFGTTDAEITFLNKQMKDSKLNLQRLKDIRAMLPSYLQMDQAFSVVNGKKLKVSSTVESIQNPANRNLIKTAPSAKNEIGAANLLRGRSIVFLYADEWAFIPYNKTIYTNTIPALKTVQINAKKVGKPYGILLTTTPGILTTDEGRYANYMRNEATQFDEMWYDLTYQQIMQIIDANTKSNFVHVIFTYQQIGRDEAWFKDMCKDMQFQWDDIRREVLLEWSENPANSPFTKEQLEAVSRLVHPPVDKKLVLGKYVLNIYNNKIPLRPDMVPRYPPIMGVDVSGGYNQDSSAITIIDSYTTEVLACLNSNSISPIDLARAIYEITTRWYPNAVINVERNGGFGASVLAALINSKVKQNLYFEIKDRVIEETNDGIRIVRKKQKTRVFGLDSTKDRRDLLIEILRQRMEYHKDKFISPIIYNELKQMEVKRNGKVEHSDNSHDDQVFSYLMALYVWYEGKNLKETFNITKSSIKTDQDIDEVVTGLEEKYSDIVKEIEFIQKENEDNPTLQQLKETKKAAGILFPDFIKKERQKDAEITRLMVQNKVLKQAYANSHNMTPEDVDSLFMTNQKGIPDSVLLGFNTYEDNNQSPEEKINQLIYDIEEEDR